MIKKIALPAALAATLTLTGCASGDYGALEAEVKSLKQEVTALKAIVEGGEAPATPADVNKPAQAVQSQSEFVTGKPFVFEGVTYTITQGERTPQLKENIKAKDNSEFIKYNIEISNTSADDYSYSQSNYKLVLSTGEIIDNYLLIDMNNELDELGLGELAPGGSRTGFVAFQIPTGDQPVEVRYEKRSISSGVKKFKVAIK